MMIIEGADLVGKSRLAATVCEHPRVQAWGMLPSHLGPLPSGWDPYWSYVRRACRDVVQDRYHMSELVYGTVIRRAPRICPDTYALLDAHLAAEFCAFTVVLTAEEPLLRERWTREELYSADEIVLVNQAFRECAQGQYGRYYPRCDVWVNCTPDKPFVTREETNEIIARYWSRRDAHARAALHA